MSSEVPNVVSPLEIEGVPVFDLHRDVLPEHWERAAAMIPPMPEEGAFIDREVWGLSGVQHVIDAIVMSNNLLAMGEAGSGKSSLAEYVAGVLRLPFCRVNCSPDMSVTDLKGRQSVGGLMTDKTDVLSWLSGDLLFALHDTPSIVLFDELNRAPADMTADLLSMLSEARVWSVPEAGIPQFRCRALLFMATANPPHYAGTFELDEALSRRFLHLPWGYDRMTEDVLIPSPTLVDMAWEIRGHASIRSILPTATLLRFCKMVKYHGHAEVALGYLLQTFDAIERQIIETTLRGRLDIVVSELLA